MFRRVFTLLSALSLLLCVAVGVLWVRSYRVVDAFTYRTSGLRIVELDRGCLVFVETLSVLPP